MKQYFQVPSIASASQYPVSFPIHQLSPQIIYLILVLWCLALLPVILKYLLAFLAKL